MAESDIFVREVDFTNIPSISIHQQTIGDVGHIVWDAALVLSKYVASKKFATSLEKKKFVELGAGPGIVGIVAAARGAEGFITDLEYIVPLIERNILTNCKGKNKVKAVILKWGSCDIPAEMMNPDYLFIADCIYYDESLDPLISTMVKICGTNTEIYLSYEERDTPHKIFLQDQFFKLAEKHFAISEIPLKDHDEMFRSPDIHIMKLMKMEKT